MGAMTTQLFEPARSLAELQERFERHAREAERIKRLTIAAADQLSDALRKFNEAWRPSRKPAN